MFWFKKKNNDKTKQEENEKIATENNKPIVIPEKTVEVNDYNGKIDNHNEFNVFIDGEDGEMMRLMSEHSHEIVRMRCKYSSNKFNKITVDSKLPALCYIEKTVETTFERRLFVTDNGNLFYQVIYFDDTVKYFRVKRNKLHEEMKIWEQQNTENPKMLAHSTGICEWEYVIPSGTYQTIKDIPDSKCAHSWESYIESYEIVDKERYDGLIRVF